MRAEHRWCSTNESGEHCNGIISPTFFIFLQTLVSLSYCRPEQVAWLLQETPQWTMSSVWMDCAVVSTISVSLAVLIFNFLNSSEFRIFWELARKCSYTFKTFIELMFLPRRAKNRSKRNVDCMAIASFIIVWYTIYLCVKLFNLEHYMNIILNVQFRNNNRLLSTKVNSLGRCHSQYCT